MAEQVTAWDNSTWVLAVMHHLDDLMFLERHAGDREITARRKNERALQREADRAGKAAANVLAALYVSAESTGRDPRRHSVEYRR